MPVLVYRITDAGFARITDAAELRVVDVVLGDAVAIAVTGVGDISTVWQTALGQGDWEMVGVLLRAGDDLDTALLISLFTDREAAADDEIPDGTNDRRGWWGDGGEPYKIGSRLWLLARAKLTMDAALKAKDYIAEALQWMLDDGVVAAINIETAVRLPSMLGAQVQISRQDGTQISYNFAWVWKKVS